MLLHAAPRQILVIGFGAGGTAWSLSRYDALQRLDIVEFVPGVIRAARFFPEVNHNVLTDPRLHVTIDDGRNYFWFLKRMMWCRSIPLIPNTPAMAICTPENFMS